MNIQNLLLIIMPKQENFVELMQIDLFKKLLNKYKNIQIKQEYILKLLNKLSLKHFQFQAVVAQVKVPNAKK